MSKLSLTPDVLAMIAERFKALAEPARLQLLRCLQEQEMSVNELVEATGLGQANVSKHLQLLHTHGPDTGIFIAGNVQLHLERAIFGSVIAIAFSGFAVGIAHFHFHRNHGFGG